MIETKAPHIPYLKKALYSRLRKFPWRRLEGAYSKGTQLRKYFFDLASPSKMERRNGLTVLGEELEHQGTVYELSAYAIGPLTYLLNRPRYPERRRVLDLLLRLACGTGGFTAHRKLSIFRDMHGEKKITREVLKEASFLKKLRTHLIEAKDVFYLLLKDRDPHVGSAATAILGRIRGNARERV